MIAITARMDEAMERLGLARKKARWRGGNPQLPILVLQQEASRGAHYDISVVFGYPDRDPEHWASLQLDQSTSTGRLRPFYDLSQADEMLRLEDDFLNFTVPLVARFRSLSGRELAEALLSGEVPTSDPRRGQVSVVMNLLDLAEAYDLPDMRQEALRIARKLDESPATRPAIRELADFQPALQEAISWSQGIEKKPWWRRR